jgi:hypothetical protein
VPGAYASGLDATLKEAGVATSSSLLFSQPAEMLNKQLTYVCLILTSVVLA